MQRPLLVLAVVVVLAGAFIGYGFYGRTTANVQTSTATAYSIQVRSLNNSMRAQSGSTILLLFNITSPNVGPLYFYAREIPAPGSSVPFNLQNVTAGDIQLPAGVSVAYPAGQAVFGTNHFVLPLRITFSPAVNGTVGLVVGAFQQVNQNQVVGAGSGLYITVYAE